MKFVTKAIILGLFSSSLMAGGTTSHSHEATISSVGAPGKGMPDRQVSVSMQDSMRYVFEPGLEFIKQGETIEFLIVNDGKIKHEFSIGNAEEQKKHAKMMQMMPDMDHKDPNAVSLQPGESASLSWKFMGKETVVFACNIPGHFEAGMKRVLAIGSKHDNGLAMN